MTEVQLRRYGPSRTIATAIAAAAVAAGLAAMFAGTPITRLTMGIAAAVLAAIAIVDLVFSPRLTASGYGLTVFAPTVRARLTWAQIDSIKVDERSHLGLSSRALEIDAGPLLVILGKRALGLDPREVLAELDRLRPRE